MQKRSNRLALRVLSTATFLAMVSSCATAAFAGTYYMEDGSISIVAKTDGNYITQGTTINDQKDAGETVITNHDSETASKNTVTIKAEEDCTANVTLDNVNIDASDTGKAAIHTEGNVTLELDGDNTLTGGTGHAGLEKNDNTGNGTLIIKDDKNDDGTEKTEEQKKAETESGKGAGSLTATGGAGGAGIGGASSRSSSNITITGGNITATAGSNSGTRLVYCGAGIGGGGFGEGNNITISGGTVNATGGEGNGFYHYGGAGIGGGADLEADEDTQNRVTIRSSEDGSPDVTAVGGAPEPGEDGTELSKGGAGIGSGALIGPDEGDREADAIISIEGKVTIKSTAGKDNAAIGANGEEQVIEGLLPGSSIDRRDADGNDISLPGDKQQPADSSEQNSDALEGLTVTDAAGKTLPYTVEWQGSTVVVTAKYPFASLQMTHETLLQLQKQGAQTLRFCTESRTASASVAELLNVSMAGAKIVWSHDGAASALQVNGADHNELLK